MKNVTLKIFVVMIVSFIVQMIVPWFTDEFALVSSDVLYRPWTLLTSIFLHGSFQHIFYNMFGMALFGLVLENIIGPKRWLLVFFSAGLLGSLVSAFFYNAALGASGAIFGILGALAVLRPRMMVYVWWVPMPMFAAVVLWAAGDLLGFFVPSGVANAAHIAGLVSGLALGFKLKAEFGVHYDGRKNNKFRIAEKEWRTWEDNYIK